MSVSLTLKNISRRYVKDNEEFMVVNNINLEVNPGEFLTFLGPSGCGKTTTLRMIAGFETPTSGQIFMDGVDITNVPANERGLGFVFQNYNLLPKTTAVENVELPLMYNPAVSAQERKARAIEALKRVGLAERLYHKSNQMSGGQMQRVAIARALVNNPAVILADEATGNLDTRTSLEILVLFQELHKSGRTIIFVTHNPELASYSSRNIVLKDGKIHADTRNNQILSAQAALDALPPSTDE